MAISSPLLETSINGARGVLINVTGSMDIGLEEVEQAASLVQQAVHPDALTIFGATFDETLDDEIRVTVIATGFDKEPNGAKEAEAAPASEEKKAAAPASEEPISTGAHGAPLFIDPDAATRAAADAEDPFADIFKMFNKRDD